MTIQAHVHPDTRGKFVVTVRDPANNEILLSSTSQGYENAGDAEKLARRLFGRTYNPPGITFYGPDGGVTAATPGHIETVVSGGGGGAEGVMVGGSDRGGTLEPVELRVTYLDGTERTEVIR